MHIGLGNFKHQSLSIMKTKEKQRTKVKLLWMKSLCMLIWLWWLIHRCTHPHFYLELHVIPQLPLNWYIVLVVSAPEHPISGALQASPRSHEGTMPSPLPCFSDLFGARSPVWWRMFDGPFHMPWTSVYFKVAYSLAGVTVYVLVNTVLHACWRSILVWTKVTCHGCASCSIYM